MDKQHFHSQTVTTQLENNRLDHRGGLIIGLILVWGGYKYANLGKNAQMFHW